MAGKRESDVRCVKCGRFLLSKKRRGMVRFRLDGDHLHSWLKVFTKVRPRMSMVKAI